MKPFIPCGLWTLVLGAAIACGSADSGDNDATSGADFGSDLDNPQQETGRLASAVTTFPGGGTSGAAQPLVAALAPETAGACDPQPTPAAPASRADVQTVCFFDPGTPDVPAATIEQVIEIVDNEEWVHVRLILNPDFVDNTFGENAIGWDNAEDGADAAPGGPGAAPEPPAASADGVAPPAPDAANAPPAPDGDAPPAAPDGGSRAGGPGADAPGDGRPGRDGAGPRPGPGKRGHTFRDLVGSDHAELQLLDADGDVSVHFKIDYISQSDDAPSGYASLGVSGGEGKLIVGEPEWILAATTSLDRNLNACALGSFTEDSPVTDELYTPDPSASDWDFRVAYEIWVAAEAFGTAGFGSALIENVHASPSKLTSDTVDVSPAPCPTDPNVPDAAPQPIPVVLENIR
jgi:hypothetical protein